MAIDILAIGAHPDDVDLTCGGTLAKAVGDGRSVVIADLTRGELGTRGTPEIRAREAAQAASILGVAERRNLDLPDGNIEVSKENVRTVMTLLRELRPRIIIIPHSEERHPDHVHAHRLCKEAWFYSGLRNLPTSAHGRNQEPHRPENFFEFMQWYEFRPSFIIDVSDVYETKMKAIRSFASQFHKPDSTEPPTKLSRPEFLELIEVRSRYYGKRIGVLHGEPFFSVAPIGVRSFDDLIMDKG
ncbi:MAG: bacillithiol biosynthesis deacetylase BshB1 [Ignavibacteria bacterium GWC2_56_12]|nr:MAG: bacillithiol biosynthesis deacetylase BshB1 [Ignavibacteria bacterium GWC2_56_12]